MVFMWPFSASFESPPYNLQGTTDRSFLRLHDLTIVQIPHAHSLNPFALLCKSTCPLCKWWKPLRMGKATFLRKLCHVRWVGWGWIWGVTHWPCLGVTPGGEKKKKGLSQCKDKSVFFSNNTILKNFHYPTNSKGFYGIHEIIPHNFIENDKPFQLKNLYTCWGCNGHLGSPKFAHRHLTMHNGLYPARSVIHEK